MENNQYKGFAYTKGSDKPTVVYGASTGDILAKLKSYNIARTEQDKFMTCNVGSLNTETSKYEDYHRYEVATGKDISSIYLQIPPLKKDEFQIVIADLKAAGARFNVQKKAWYISADQNLQEFQDICNQFSNKNTKDTLPRSNVPFQIEEMMPFQIEGMEIQYALKMENQQTVIFPESTINMLRANGPMNEFLDRLNEKAVEQLQQLASDREQINLEQIASESEYMVSVNRDSHFNRCTVWYSDGREPVSLNGDVYGLDFLTMETDAVAEFVAAYHRQQDHPELSMQMKYRKGDWIDCFVPLNPQESSAIMRHQPLYVEGIRHVVGTVQEVWPVFGGETDAKSYEILDKDGNVDTIRSDEIYAPDQARVLLRAAGDELTGVQFDLLADRRLSAAQMEEIRFGFKDGLSVEQVALYANPEMTPAEMDMCRIGLTNGLEYAELSSLLKETKELSWTDSRNQLNEVIKEHRVVEKARTAIHEAGKEATVNSAAEPTTTELPDPSISVKGMSEIQQHIVEHIQENFVNGSVSIEPVGDDKIRITDLTGESMNLAMTQSGGIIDADTNKIYGYAKDGYRPTAGQEKAESTAQTADFFGTEVPVEKGMRVISSDEIFFGLSDRDNIEVLDFTNCIFHDIDFSQAFWDKNLSDADFSNSRFYDCKFDDVDLSRSSFQGSSLYNTRFKNAILKQCDFSKATISGSVFQASDVVEVNFSEAAMKHTVFRNCAMEGNNFLVTRMDAVDVAADCDITADQKYLDTIAYTMGGATDEEIERAEDKVMWRLSGSEITYERKEELIRLMENTRGNPDAQEWRDDLTDAERDFVMDKTLQQKSQQSLSDVLLEKQHRQERYNNMAAQAGENQLDKEVSNPEKVGQQKIITQEIYESMMSDSITSVGQDFTNCMFRDVKFNWFRPQMPYTDQTVVDVVGFHGADFTGSCFVNCDFSSVQFHNSSFEKCRINDCVFNRNHIDHCNFSNAYISVTRMNDISMINSNLYKATISNTDISNSQLINNNLFWTTIHGDPNLKACFAVRNRHVNKINYSFWVWKQHADPVLGVQDQEQVSGVSNARQKEFHEDFHNRAQWTNLTEKELQLVESWRNRWNAYTFGTETLRKREHIIADDIRSAGWRPTNGLVDHMMRLEQITGKAYTLKSVCDLCKKSWNRRFDDVQDKYISDSDKTLFNKTLDGIAQECRGQELARMRALQAAPAM